MIKAIVRRIVDYQVNTGNLKSEERNIYLYGYQMLIETCINIAMAIMIAIVFDAVGITICFSAAYLVLRGYAGGYHAKTSWGCFFASAMVLVFVIHIVKYFCGMEGAINLMGLEIIMMPLVLWKTPLPSPNKPITENETAHFNRRIKQIYFIEIIVAMCFLKIYSVVSFSILLAHALIFIMVIGYCGDVYGRRN